MNTDQRQLRLLLVDDSELQLQFEQALLADAPYELLVARNGAEALERARQEQPDLILMDIVMPVMDGIAAANALREDPVTADIPIIMVTSQTEADYMENAFVGGCNDYVTKPVHREELLAKIRWLTGDGDLDGNGNGNENGDGG